jgi:hypothetical protein
MPNDELMKIAEWAIPYNSNCPQKKAFINYKREKLITKIIEYASRCDKTQQQELPKVSEHR